jgi:hypothetical protein
VTSFKAGQPPSQATPVCSLHLVQLAHHPAAHPRIRHCLPPLAPLLCGSPVHS